MARILLVDDEPFIRISTRKMLERAGHGVVEAKDGEDGLRVLENDKPDLILLDVRMPGTDGWEICREIKEAKETRDIPVVICSVYTSGEFVKKSMEYAGADAHINKPFSMDELLNTVEKVLEKVASP